MPVALGLGANVGAPRRQLLDALVALSRLLGALRTGPLVRTPPHSPISQPPYLNTAVVARSHLPPRDLLAALQALERAAGRRPGPRWGPRPLDLDLLLYGQEERSDPELRLPHPRLAERSFVLVPLAAVAEGWRVPGRGATVGELCQQLGEDPELEVVPWAGGD